ncbi:unnamed protein product, partial [Timema podura]|nr:unnamed protein product [Timema podura]
MAKYTTHEKVYLVEKYLKYKHKKCVRKFRLRFPMTPIPSKSSIVKLVKKWRRNGTVQGIGLRPRLRPHVSSKLFLVIKSLLDNEPSISIRDISKVTYLSRQVVKKVKKRIETDSTITHSMTQLKINNGYYKNLGLHNILGNLKRRLGKEYTIDNIVTAESVPHKRHHSRMEGKTPEQVSGTAADAT